MDHSVARDAVGSLVRSAADYGFRSLRLKYAGGEASLNAAVLLALHDHAIARCAETGLALSAVLLSNGAAISNSPASDLTARGIRVMISLDGIGAARCAAAHGRRQAILSDGSAHHRPAAGRRAGTAYLDHRHKPECRGSRTGGAFRVGARPDFQFQLLPGQRLHRELRRPPVRGARDGARPTRRVRRAGRLRADRPTGRQLPPRPAR